MRHLKTLVNFLLVLMLLAPTAALCKKPDITACPCRNLWAWYSWPAECTYDLDLIMRGGWPSQSEVPSPIAEVRWTGFSDYFDFATEYGVKEHEGEFICYLSGYGNTLPDPTSLYVESDPLSFDQAKSCDFAARDFFDYLEEKYEFCE